MSESDAKTQAQGLTRGSVRRALQHLLLDTDAIEMERQGGLADELREARTQAGVFFASIRSEKRDALQDIFLNRHAPIVEHMDNCMTEVAGDLHALSQHAAASATKLDPHACGRILARMNNLGDIPLRQIEGRLAASDSRTKRKQLQDLRDEMWKWLAERDAKIHEAQLAAEDLSARISALSRECLEQSGLLSETADIAFQAAGRANTGVGRDPSRHLAPEAVGLTASLRAFVWSAKARIAAPLRQG